MSIKGGIQLVTIVISEVTIDTYRESRTVGGVLSMNRC